MAVPRVKHSPKFHSHSVNVTMFDRETVSSACYHGFAETRFTKALYCIGEMPNSAKLVQTWLRRIKPYCALGVRSECPGIGCNETFQLELHRLR